MREPKLNSRLRAARLQNMWTLEEAAQKVGVNAQTFWRWEHYEQWPRPYALRKLCAIFGLSVEELGFRRCFSASVGEKEENVHDATFCTSQ